VRILDLKQKLTDKYAECDSYIQISEHRLLQYNDLMSKKKELEQQKDKVNLNMDHLLQDRDYKIELLKAEIQELGEKIIKIGIENENDLSI
jgi:hypothetical protein